MRLTTKGRFAVTAMMDLALRGQDGPVALAGVSERQKISLSYLEQLFGKLRRHGLDATQCGGRENCLDDQRCMTHDLWSSLNTRMYDYLASVTLADLVVRQREKEAKAGVVSVIADRRAGPHPRSRSVREKVAAVI